MTSDQKQERVNSAFISESQKKDNKMKRHPKEEIKERQNSNKGEKKNRITSR